MSVLEDGHNTFITGIEFTGENKTVRVGHISSPGRIKQDIRSLRGFKIAMSNEGIHAIKFNTSTTDCSWIGKITKSCWVLDMSEASDVFSVLMGFDVGVAFC